VELEVEQADTDDGQQHENTHDHEQHIRLPRCGDEGRQVMDRDRV
jgi:hypothetical protein